MPKILQNQQNQINCTTGMQIATLQCAKKDTCRQESLYAEIAHYKTGIKMQIHPAKPFLTWQNSAFTCNIKYAHSANNTE